MSNSETSTASDRFDEFVRIEGRRLQLLLVSAHGLAIGSDATQAALVYGWENWSRVAVLLIHGHGYPLAEVATLLDGSVSTVRNHLRRRMDKLRQNLGVETKLPDEMSSEQGDVDVMQRVRLLRRWLARRSSPSRGLRYSGPDRRCIAGPGDQ